MARTIIQTQVRLRRYLAMHYHAEEDVLFPRDDPYTSDEQLTGCFLGAGSWPPELPKRLTYGMVQNAFKGVFELLYQQRRYAAADFLIVDDRLGAVGVGRIARERTGRNEVASALV